MSASFCAAGSSKPACSQGRDHLPTSIDELRSERCDSGAEAVLIQLHINRSTKYFPLLDHTNLHSHLISYTSFLFQSSLNFLCQTGKMGGEVYRAAGMTGKGQVCGIADSGLNDLSCFFFDGPTSTHTSSPPHHPNTSLSPLHSTHALSAHRGVLTNRSGIIEPFRRKVIQYVAYADEMDGIGEWQW